MIELSNVTMCCIDTVGYGQAIDAIQKSLKLIKPARTILFTDIEVSIPGVDVIQIPHIYSKKGYSEWMIKEFGKHEITTSHVLVIQSDGYVLDSTVWTDEFLDYDYGGSVWPEIDGYSVGNGGFSIRSWKLHQVLSSDPLIKGLHPEDSAICRIYRDYLEKTYGIKFMPELLAHRFAFELCQPHDKTFGFHGDFHDPYVEPIVLKRSGAMGDVIQVEPILEYYFSKGHPVYLDTPEQFYQLFGRHYFPVGHYSKFDHTVIKHRYINLDMAYEVYPQQLHQKTYFEMCGIEKYRVRKPKLSFNINDGNKLFNTKYAVIHIDERDTPYRNIYNVDWSLVTKALKALGYTVIQIGHGPHEQVALKVNTVTPAFLLWLVAGANLFIGIDSGPSHIAVACGVKSIIFFGSVNPAYIHPDLSNIHILRNECPIGNDYCWHLSPGTSGTECAIEESKHRPPCCVFETGDVLNMIQRAAV